MAKACDADIINIKAERISKELAILYLTAGCNILLLILNITILFAIISYMKPAISEIRKQTFIIMDCILLTYIPNGIRDILGCKPELKLEKRQKDTGKTGKPGKTGKGKKASTTSKSKKSTTGRGTTKTGTMNTMGAATKSD
ncbi:G_PROTEIN_RECEP_F1_2 domain-containing protein [Caenorhabditis elegans]|uniref:G_PROTEIN_RECEP_F1_2 domain-containing protein n=1 Tax=Caenorhabditis elegans TaxID=6239 RepID=O01432_CAEEL|nr:G_PROTEIN_RECEP_F1_2 domain-containing protein [Caenorhabditis elegans]CCD61321.1 G_PROTEIN_RECEP_F1_2 domain-containing protein [Caenorhabditis elegans]|eukprot:NP_491719.1 Uncharacterized protein CELE_B0207.9 [Caenorhabditis elegans]